MPNVYILHGEEELLRAEALAKLRHQVAVEGMGDLNVTTLNARDTSVRELKDICNTMPFLAPQRLVIIEDLLAKLDTSKRSGETQENSDAAEIIGYLSQVPPTTLLVFVESRPLSKGNPVLKAAKADKEHCTVQQFGQLDSRGGQVENWINERAAHKHVSIDGAAVALLATSTGNDLRRIDQELEKLAAYVGYQGSINRETVQNLVPPVFEEKIFSLVDALGQRNVRTATRMLEEFLDNRVNELYLLTMIARQFRLIIGAQDLAGRGMSFSEIGKQLNASSRNDFVVRKLLQQAQMFDPSELVRVQEMILATDQAIKTGKMEPTLAIQTLAISICAHRRSSPQKARSSARTR